MDELEPDGDDGSDFESGVERLDSVGNRDDRDDAQTSAWRVAAFKRQMEAEERLYEWWEQRYPGTTWVAEVLGSAVEESSSLWVAALGEKVAAMGGHLELVAVFENETLTLVREPGPGAGG